MNSRVLTKQELINAEEKAFWEDHVIAIFSLILSLTVVIPLVVMGCLMLYLHFEV
jgi:hypothetical protein